MIDQMTEQIAFSSTPTVKKNKKNVQVKQLNP